MTDELTLEERALRHAEATDILPMLEAELAARLAGPQTMTGACRRLCIRPGFDLGLYDITLTGEMPDGGEISAGLTVTVLLEGAGQSWVRQPGRAASRPIPYAGGMTYFCFCQEAVTGGMRLPRRSRFRAAELRMDLDFLRGLGLLEPLAGAGRGHPLTHIALDSVWIGLLPTPERLATVAAMLSRLPSTRPEGDLVLERGALDMLFTCAGLIRQPPVLAGPAPRDLEALHQARALLSARPEEPWTIAALAREAGLTEKRLKLGFRQRFGVTVNRFLQQVRLRTAHRMITEDGASITEAALAVGYANPSHFAFLFRREYGAPPSQVARAGAATPAPPDRPLAGSGAPHAGGVISGSTGRRSGSRTARTAR
ncbi:AraC family transcriptional regulator [Siccirubricoccus phaeus]|uniref:AraC family transcriptional regulator n=1 Tax=Siccirubricoccus phaeus TaxID=2595053 RepID=UPI00165C9C0C|nr:AraC family transcriptional regulator [Siccirubricoccus phaeus]